MSRDSRLWTVAAVSVLVGAVIGAGVVYAAQQRSAAETQAQLVEARAAAQAARQQAREASAALAAAQAPQKPETPGASQTGTTQQPTTPAKPAATVKHFAFISKVTPSATPASLVADYAQMLSGDAAAAAAAAHGDESPPPNDYYIVNDSKKLRKLKVKSGIKVTIVSNPDGTSDPSGHSVTFAEWAANFTSPTAENEALRTGPYWIWVKNGVVTKIEQQYLP